MSQQFAFPPELKDEIRDRIDIVALIGETVKLKKSGSTFSGLCPFHKEQTASFSVVPAKRIYHCFGCKEGGDCFSFVMKIQNISFSNALEKLAVQAGIDISRYERKSEAGFSYQRLYDANAAALQFFCDQLKHATIAQEYLKKRGLSGATAKNFSLGYAPDTWSGCADRLREQGFSEQELVNVGLARRRDTGGGVYDYFRNRVIFPIHDDKGHVVAFGGRTLGEDRAKYLNSPETDIYSKGRTLYNLHRVPSTPNGTLVIVEGYMDVVGLAQGGVTNAIAVLGTALTEPHIRKISRVAKTLYLGYDPDEAGVRAAVRSLALLESEGMTVKVLSLPDGLDPDELVLERGKAAWEQALTDAAEVEDYLFDVTVKPFDLKSLPQRREAVRQLQAVYPFLPSVTSRDRFLQRVISRMQLSEDVVRTSFVTEGRRQLLSDDRLAPRTKPRELTAAAKTERHLLAYMLADGGVYERNREHIRLEDLEDPLVKRALEVLAGLPSKTGPLNETLLSHVEDSSFQSFIAEVLSGAEPAEDNLQRSVTDCLGTLRKQRLQQKVRSLKERVKTCQDASERKALLQEQSQVLEELVRM